jgi:hypothetical protein
VEWVPVSASTTGAILRAGNCSRHGTHMRRCKGRAPVMVLVDAAGGDEVFSAEEMIGVGV